MLSGLSGRWCRRCSVLQSISFNMLKLLSCSGGVSCCQGRKDRECISWSLTEYPEAQTVPRCVFGWRRFTKVLHDKSWSQDSFGFVTAAEWCFGFSRFLLLNGKVCDGQEKRPIGDLSLKKGVCQIFFFFTLTESWCNRGCLCFQIAWLTLPHLSQVVAGWARGMWQHVWGTGTWTPWSWLWAGCA